MSLVNVFKRCAHFALLTNKSFRLHRWFDVFVAPVHYYTPIPDIRQLNRRPEFWRQASELVGIDMDPEGQRRLMRDVFQKYRSECDFTSRPTAVPYAYYTLNDYFGYVSAVAMHGMVRAFRPRKIVEVGAGFSTRVLANAALLNTAEGEAAELIAIDPYPAELLQRGFPGLSRLIQCEVQNGDAEVFQQLSAADLLSIDSSHTVCTGSDVNLLFLEVLPRLSPGAVVHFHDIFLPYEYPRHWVQRRHFWNEQYLLHAFLIHNSGFRVLWGQMFARVTSPDLYAETFGQAADAEESFESYSFWIQRVA